MSIAVDEQLVLSRYRVVRHLAQGGMGVVYLGRVEGAAGFSKPVVIKRVISGADTERSTARFIREAQILSNLQHPGIVGVLDFGEERDGYAMVLEYVHGYDLGRWLKYLRLTSARMHWEEAVFIGARVLDALHYAHTFRSSGGSGSAVLHRDVSPGNILLDLEGQVRLLDFGIARMADGEAGQYKTDAGVINGKVAFLAPELFGGAPPSTSSDTYACAVVLYQMLAGVHPFAGDTDEQVIWRVMSQAPRPLSAIRDDLPPELECAVLLALAKEPEERPPTAADLARTLRGTLRRPENEIAAGLRERLRVDFNGNMPRLLQIEPLAQRDLAWRSSQESGQVRAQPLRSSQGPSKNSQRPTVTPRRRPGKAAPTETHPTASTATTGVTAIAPRAEVGQTFGSTRPRRTHVFLFIGLGLGLAVLVGAAVILVRQLAPEPAAGAARFIVVQSPDRPRRTDPAAVAPAVSDERAEPEGLPSDTLPAGHAAPAHEPLRSAKPAASTDSGARGLTRQFARRQSALETCFDRHTAELEGQPELAIEFEVATSGRVAAANLSPAALTGTPFGQCLLSVAKETVFDKQLRPIRFAIPLRARAVSN